MVFTQYIRGSCDSGRTMTLDTLRDSVNVLERSKKKVLVVSEQEEYVGWLVCRMIVRKCGIGKRS